jgi:hypothetical protein
MSPNMSTVSALSSASAAGSRDTANHGIGGASSGIVSLPAAACKASVTSHASGLFLSNQQTTPATATTWSTGAQREDGAVVALVDLERDVSRRSTGEGVARRRRSGRRRTRTSPRDELLRDVVQSVHRQSGEKEVRLVVRTSSRRGISYPLVGASISLPHRSWRIRGRPEADAKLYRESGERMLRTLG